VTLTTPTLGHFVITRLILLGPTRAQNMTILSSAVPEKFKGCKILKWIVTRATPLSGIVSVRMLTFDIARKHRKFDDSIASAVPEIFQVSQVWNSRMRPWPWPRPLRRQLLIWRLVGLLLPDKHWRENDGDRDGATVCLQPKSHSTPAFCCPYCLMPWLHVK